MSMGWRRLPETVCVFRTNLLVETEVSLSTEALCIPRFRRPDLGRWILSWFGCGETEPPHRRQPVGVVRGITPGFLAV